MGIKDEAASFKRRTEVLELPQHNSTHEIHVVHLPACVALAEPCVPAQALAAASRVVRALGVHVEVLQRGRANFSMRGREGE